MPIFDPVFGAYYCISNLILNVNTPAEPHGVINGSNSHKGLDLAGKGGIVAIIKSPFNEPYPSKYSP